MSLIRASVVAALLLATSAFTSVRTAPVRTLPAMNSLPMTLGRWHGANAEPLDEATRRELGADAYVTRTYASAGAAPVGLYVAYYAQQRPTVSIHSPLNCLPGTGWEPLDVSTIDIGDATLARPARRMVVSKNLDRALVVYWYAIHGRVVANEIASKFWLLHDSLLSGRSDAALVRVTVPIESSVAPADSQLVAFARALVPHLTFQER